jgi:hypothetical protein
MRTGALRPAYVVFAMALAFVSALTPAQGQAEVSEWSLPENLGPPINTGGTEVGPHISKNGLSLYHLRNFNIFVSQRATVDDAWGARQDLGTNMNTRSTKRRRVCRSTSTSCCLPAPVREDSAALTSMSRDGTAGVTIWDGSCR